MDGFLGSEIYDFGACIIFVCAEITFSYKHFLCARISNRTHRIFVIVDWLNAIFKSSAHFEFSKKHSEHAGNMHLLSKANQFKKNFIVNPPSCKSEERSGQSAPRPRPINRKRCTRVERQPKKTGPPKKL